LRLGIGHRVLISNGKGEEVTAEIISFNNSRKVIRSKADSGNFDYTSHAKLREALQSQLFDERSDIIRLTVSSRNPDPEALEKLNSVIKTLVEKHGYSHESANQLLRFVNSIMSK